MQVTEGEADYYTEDLGDGVELEMISIPGGSFIMGSPKEELESYDDERPQHQVTVPSFYMGRYPVTQAQWKAIAESESIERELELDPSNFKEDYEDMERWQRPVEQVYWEDAKEFCARLSRETEREYRLPTEAEWEYACRAGTNTPFHFGETISTNLANYRGTDDENFDWKGFYGRGVRGEYRGQTTPVGYFQVVNNFGLSDMHGNVREWCEDDWHDSYENAPNNGSTWLSEEGNRKVIRGGSWLINPDNCRSAIRYYAARDNRNDSVGFRVVCVAPRTT
ncbi:MAG: formylglycine-generating enzyme family protein [Cyanobacteria bacterium P01_F01_bin.143]